jgi:hypothetical protein
MRNADESVLRYIVVIVTTLMQVPSLLYSEFRQDTVYLFSAVTPRMAAPGPMVASSTASRKGV